MTTKLQVPIDSDVRDGLEIRAKELGFDSAQAYIRVWAKSEVEGRRIDFGAPSITLSPSADNRYEKSIADMEKLRKAGKLKAYSTVEEFMKDLK
ncbi:MAG TPA: hypothetical protein VGF75_06010 [Candidatus Saccharimonadales bacterium]|jgi:hypothetical protein